MVVVQTVELVAGPSGADDGSSTNDPLSPAVVIDRLPQRTNYWTTLRAAIMPQDQGGRELLTPHPLVGPPCISRWGAFVRELILDRSFDVSMLQSRNYFSQKFDLY